jgi:hypothetical protein
MPIHEKKTLIILVYIGFLDLELPGFLINELSLSPFVSFF